MTAWQMPDNYLTTAWLQTPLYFVCDLIKICFQVDIAGITFKLDVAPLQVDLTNKFSMTKAYNN